METVHLLISGKVQGVFFRNSARMIAEKLQVTGWIKNTSHEKVEAMVTGDGRAINEFINWCKKGPERATVTDVKISKQPETLFEDFRIARN
ncbi:MAG: acylphosphatase [Ginsengibacter sp.]